MFFLFYYPVKVILKQAAAWFLIPGSLAYSILDQPVPAPMFNHPHHVLDLTIRYKKGYLYINKRFCIDSFLDLGSHNWVWISLS